MGEGLRVELRLVQRFGGWGWPCVVQRDSRQLHVKQYCKAINKQIHPSRPVHSNIKAVHAPCAPSSTTHPHACSVSQRPCTLPITCPITLSALAGVVAYMPVFMLCARQTPQDSRSTSVPPEPFFGLRSSRALRIRLFSSSSAAISSASASSSSRTAGAPTEGPGALPISAAASAPAAAAREASFRNVSRGDCERPAGALVGWWRARRGRRRRRGWWG